MPTSHELFNILAQNSHAPQFMENSQGVYDSILTMVDDVLDVTNEAERDERMKNLYISLINETAKNALIHRGIMSWSMDMREKYQDRTIVSAMATSQLVEEMLCEALNEKGTDYVCKEKMGMSNEEYMDYIRSLATSVTMKDVQDEFFKQSTVDSRQNSMSMLAEELLDKRKNIVYSGDLSNQNDRKVSEAYAVYDNAWKNIKEAGFWGNFFHPINFFKNVGIIRTANAIFKKTGFNVETDGPAAMEAFETTTDYCADKDLVHLAEMKKDFKDNEKQQIKDSNIKEISVARDKLNNTLAAIKNGTMEHPMHKVNAILAKYGVSVTEDAIYRPGRIDGITSVNEELLAEEYDKTRQTEQLQQYFKGIFFKGLNSMMSATIASGKPMNISEILKDASDISVMMAKDYTVLYEEPELKALAENSAFGSYDSEKVFEYVQRNLDSNNATDKYDLDALKNEIEQTMKEYKNPIIENSKVEKMEETVNENNMENVQNKEPLIEKITVDLSDKKAEIEPKHDELDGKSLAKNISI